MPSIAIGSGKGGVGKSLTAINLGAALATAGADVLVVDGNLPTPDLSMYFNVSPKTKTLNEVLRGEARPEEAIFQDKKTGLKVMPASIRLNDVRGFTEKDVEQTLKNVCKYAKNVIIDCAPGLGFEMMGVVKAADRLLVIANPELPAVVDAYKTIRVAKAFKIPVEGVVLNRVGRFKGEMTSEDVRSVMEDTPVLAKIPEDARMPRAASRSQPVLSAFPYAPSSRAFKKLAAKMMGMPYKESLWTQLRGVLGG